MKRKKLMTNISEVSKSPFTKKRQVKNAITANMGINLSAPKINCINRTNNTKPISEDTAVSA